MSSAAQAQPLTDVEYKLLLVAYIHSLPEGTLNKGRVISFLFAAAGPVGNNPSSMPALLSELGVESIVELEDRVNGFALSAKRNLLNALKKTRTSILNALPPDFPANSKEEADIHVKPVLASVAKKVQALQEAARHEDEELAAAQAAEPAEAAAAAAGTEAPFGEEEEAAAPPPRKKRPALVRAMIWQPPIKFSHAEKLGRGESERLHMQTPFDGDIVLGAGALMYRLKVEDDAVRIQHYEMYGEHRPDEDVVFPVGQRFVIGRGAQAHHRRPDQDEDPGSRGLSRKHVAVLIQRTPEGVLTISLEDLGSTNGTPVWWNLPKGAEGTGESPQATGAGPAAAASAGRPTETGREASQSSGEVAQAGEGPPVAMKHSLELWRGGEQQSLDESFGGEAWLKAGSMYYRVQAVGGSVRVTHHDLDGKAYGDADPPRDHPPAKPFTIGRDHAIEHHVPDNHPGATGLSRKHVTVMVSASGGALRLQVNDHSSNGTLVYWNPPPGG